MRIKRSKDKGFKEWLLKITGRGGSVPAGIEEAVKDIIGNVRARGDRALCDYTKRFDSVSVKINSKSGKGFFEVSKREINRAYNSVPAKDLEVLEAAAERIESFHLRLLEDSWSYTDTDGSVLGVKVTPVERAGIYVPGGKAAYPSTVLMNAIPAEVAGVDEVVMVTPPTVDGINPYVLAAAKLAGVDKVFRVGGAQAIAALAYGTESIRAVDKITGPGNIYVATAKRLVYGTVDIDMIAGPSEILIINDGTGEASWMAADLLAQAEHDEQASSILITTSLKIAREVAGEVEAQLKRLKKRGIAAESIERYGAIIVVKELVEAVEISNSIAPEHLELFVKEPEELLPSIRNAGAVFLGYETPEAFGDYLAGPNHTLPTGGTARFSSPLGVQDFLKRTSIIGLSEAGIRKFGRKAARLAAIEGLGAHAKSVNVRLAGLKKSGGTKSKS